jgi:hypothetical protein
MQTTFANSIEAAKIQVNSAMLWKLLQARIPAASAHPCCARIETNEMTGIQTKSENSIKTASVHLSARAVPSHFCCVCAPPSFPAARASLR